MDKSVIFSVAGAGKTTLIIDRLGLEKRYLIVTFTENNHINLRRKVVEKFGYIPPNISIYTYFTFLHSFCYRPLLGLKLRTKGMNMNQPPPHTAMLSRANEDYYLDSTRRIYKGRLAKLLETQGVIPEVVERIEKYYDALYVDEVQDFAGHDFNFLATLASASLDLLLVGDFYQHTFDTSRDGMTNKNLHDDYKKYRARFKNMGVAIDDETLSKTWRCPPAVSAFIRDNVGIDIYSHGENETKVVLVDDKVHVEAIWEDGGTVKLFYQEHEKYGCYSQNWGGSKGDDHYGDVCVVLNPKTLKAYKDGGLSALPSMTRNKLYVACSRTRGHLYLVPEAHFKKYKA